MIRRDDVLGRYVAAGKSIPLLTLSEFFDDNADEESLAPNQWGEGRPPLAEIARRLGTLDDDPAVSWVRVQLHEETFEDGVDWVAAEAVAICTSLDPDDVAARLDVDELQADGVIDGYVYDEDAFADAPPAPPGHRVLSLVWD
ncbi:hypothetical protein [Cellulosimicrobium sp. NPDC057127]|uniref:hypothetical protein n=1 Tax=Cellulosimicrobium sp. NPDC057127 TaxID=3346026 RepID=UPI00362944C1